MLTVPRLAGHVARNQIQVRGLLNPCSLDLCTLWPNIMLVKKKKMVSTKWLTLLPMALGPRTFPSHSPDHSVSQLSVHLLALSHPRSGTVLIHLYTTRAYPAGVLAHGQCSKNGSQVNGWTNA